MIQYPSNIVKEAGQHTDKKLREVIDNANGTMASLASLTATLAALPPPLTLATIQKELQLGGSFTINVTGVPGVLPQAQIAATVGTHAKRLTVAAATGAVWIESDRGYVYYGSAATGPVWTYVSGISYGLHSARWADLGAADAGALYLETNRSWLYEWDGTKWVYRAGVMVGLLAALPVGLGANDAGALYDATDIYTQAEWDGSFWVTVGGAFWRATVDSVKAAQWVDQSGLDVIVNIDTVNLRVGVNTAAPTTDHDVAGIQNARTGYRQSNTGASPTAGHVLRSNGTNFIDALLAAADLSNGVTGTGAVVLASVLGAPGVHTITLAALTTLGTQGSITWNAQGIIVSFVDPT